MINQNRCSRCARITVHDRPEYAPIEFLNGIGAGVIELKINGSPAYRCIYITKYIDTVIVLHSFTKTTNGVDRQAMKTAEQRLKELKAQL